MKYLIMRLLRYSLVVLATLLVGRCAGTDEMTDRGEASPSPAASSVERGPDLAVDREEVGLVQLYPDGRETGMPVVMLNGDDHLVLSFDLLEGERRPLSIYFYHADRRWERDLTPIEYLSGYRRDQVMDYADSRATVTPYVHYTYRFPNGEIDFEISGNYVVRVTEQGSEEEVLFERAFFVTEGAASSELELERLLIGGGRLPSVQPILRFSPTSRFEAGSFDYTACFVANGRVAEPRCSDRPRTRRDGLRFELEPERAFEVQRAHYFVDLAEVNVGPKIAETDHSTTPVQAILEPDYARFPDQERTVLMNGQPRVADVVRNVGEPEVEAEYVEVGFRYVPPGERPLRGSVVVTGSFNNWQHDERYAMEWNAETQQYEASVLLKQGQYEYTYLSDDPRLHEALRKNAPRTENLFTAFVYYADAGASTDRLLSVQQALMQ